MKPEIYSFILEPNVNIGKIIEENTQRHSKTDLAKDLHCHKNTIENIYKNENIVVDRLVQISLLSTQYPTLYPKYNFFQHYRIYVTQEILKTDRDLRVEDIEDLTDINISIINIGGVIEQKRVKNRCKFTTLAKMLSITESPASRISKRSRFDVFLLFNVSIWLKYNLFVCYYENVEKQLRGFSN